jgi:hypothetical protein
VFGIQRMAIAATVTRPECVIVNLNEIAGSGENLPIDRAVGADDLRVSASDGKPRWPCRTILGIDHDYGSEPIEHSLLVFV